MSLRLIMFTTAKGEASEHWSWLLPGDAREIVAALEVAIVEAEAFDDDK